MYSVYKKFTAQDTGLVPFNAHKQYNFISSSAATNKITHFDATWSSASIDSFSSGAKGGTYPSVDTNNTLKYFQLDHLYYKNYKRDINNKLGYSHYLKHKRELYKNIQVLSTPAGLYGHQIKPSTFYLSASDNSVLGLGGSQSYFEIVDDSNGNLILSGSNKENHNTDIRANILKIGPEKGFKKYDLNVINDDFEAGVWYRRGKERVNKISRYSTPQEAGDQFDDSYYFNLINYKNVTFSEVDLNGGKYSQIEFYGNAAPFHSGIEIENDDKFNFNPGEDFTINLWAEVTNSNVSSSIYLISKSTTKTVVPSPITGKSELYNTDITGALQPRDVPSSPQYPFEIYVQNNTSGTPHLFFRRSDGKTTTSISSSFTTGSMQHITCRVSSSEMEIFINGVTSGVSGMDNSKSETQNNANLYIGNRGGFNSWKDHYETYLEGKLSQINIYDDALTDTQVLNHYNSSNGSPYIGNCFYETGISTITHPNYQGLNFEKLGWDLNSLTFITSSDISAVEVDGQDLFFKPDGTKMYTIGKTTYGISQWDLSTPWDINSKTYINSINLTNAGVAGEYSWNGLFFKPDGTTAYAVGSDKDHIIQIPLGDPWEISPSNTGSIDSASVLSQNDSMQGMYFKEGGYTLYLLGFNPDDQIYQYSLTKAYDITTMTHVGTSACTTLGGGSPRGIWFRPDGKAVFVVENTSTDQIEERTLSTAWDITTTSQLPSREINIQPQDAHPMGVYVNQYGNKLFTIGFDNDNIYEYSMSYNEGLQLKFQGSHLIYENEYQCTVEEYEFNDTMNISARYYRNTNCPDLAQFATGSLFKPYVTTIGLYNEEGDLLVVGKMGQPVRMSDETDTTFVIRWDS